jgi:hypothetical protein
MEHWNADLEVQRICSTAKWWCADWPEGEVRFPIRVDVTQYPSGRKKIAVTIDATDAEIKVKVNGRDWVRETWEDLLVAEITD